MTSISISPTFYQFIRDQTIHDHIDALVELITNSIDAYKSTDKPICQIDIYWHKDKLVVVDQAIGLDASKMIQCFMQVGKYTSSMGNRGFFSRGAKDISALGNITITAIKDNYYSQCRINNDLTVKLLCGDDLVNSDIRKTYKIRNNGLHFQVDLLDTYKLKNKDEVIKKIKLLSNHFSLRDYLCNERYVISSHYDNNNFQHSYDPPKGELLLDMTEKLDEYGYPNASYRFRLWRAKEPLGDQMSETDNRFIKFGILVKTSSSIHDNNTIYPQIRYESGISELFGTLECDYIDNLMNKFIYEPEFNDKTKNPFPIIDSGRINGLNIDHPFTKAIYDKPYQRLIYILNDITENISDGGELVLDDIAKLFDSDSDDDFEIRQNLSPLFGRFDSNLIKSVSNKIVSRTKNIQELTSLKYSSDNIKVRVEDKIGEKRGRLKIIPKFTNKELKNNQDYEIIKTLNGYTIYVSTQTSLLKNFIEAEEEISLKTNTSKSIVSQILSSATTEILTNNYFQNKKDYNSFDVFNKSHHYFNKIKDRIFNNIFFKNGTSD